MSVLPNLRNTGTGQSYAYIDTPNFAYDQWLQGLNGGPIGTVTGNPSVAIIGAGVSGLCAAYELSQSRAGCVPYVFEQAGEVGGRAASDTFPSDPSGNDIAEMGSMRFPPSEFLLNYYLVQLGLVPGGLSSLNDFPDPGVHPTYVCYGNGQNPNDPDPPPKVQTWVKPSAAWPNGTKFPQGFATVYNGWVALCSNGLTPTGNLPPLLGAYQIQAQLQQNNSVGTQAAVTAWQNYLNVFGQDTFYSALYKIFTGSSGYQIPGGTAWTFADFDKFGALGLGSGGFGPLYPIGFCEILRIVVDGLEDHQKFLKPTATLQNGIRSLPLAFANAIPSISFAYNAPITGITGNLQSGFTLTGPKGPYGPFARVIVATTTRSMELTLGLTEYDNGFVSAAVARAIMRTHVVSSNKVASLIPNFWANNPGAIRSLQTDGTAHQVYTLDYTPVGQPENTTGVCFISYVWDDDAVKQQSITNGAPTGPAENTALYSFLANSILAIGDPVKTWAQNSLQPLNFDYDHNIIFEEWQSSKYFGGAFKLSEPGQDQYVTTMFFDYQKAGTANDTGVYIAGDCISWTSGWTEGALTTGLNAAAAVITSLGGQLYGNPNTSLTPMSSPSQYNYI
jgi:tryptophan 2-monooxygenase